MADYFLSDLVESFALVNTDLLHIRTAGNIDKKIQLINFFKTFRDIYSKNANYTILDADRNPIILVDSTSGNVTITLPTLADNQNKEIWIVKLVAANNVIIDGEGAETINGVADYTLIKQYEVSKIIATSGNWNIDGKSIIRAVDIDFGIAAGDVDADILPLGTVVTSSPTGGTPTSLANTSFVRAAIQTVFNRLIDLSGVANIAIKARHIDFSVNAGDVDADVLPLGTAITSSPTGGTPTNLANTSFVRAAIQEVLNRLKDLSGVQNDAVDSRHLNWGTGAGQIGLLKGHLAIQLTNYATSGVPQIAALGSCEINGQLYTNPSAITITGTTADDTWYDILLTPSGSTYTASFVAKETGVWSDSKQGLYSGNNRVVACVLRVASDNWINKNILEIRNRIVSIKLKTGAWNMVATSDIAVTHGFTQTKIRHVSVFIYRDAEDNAFDIATDSGAGGAGYIIIRPTDIFLYRKAGGFFDSSEFDDTVINRGWIFIECEV